MATPYKRQWPRRLGWLLILLSFAWGFSGVRLPGGSWLPAAAISVSVMLALHALNRLDRALAQVRQARRDLSSQWNELALLQALGPKLLAATDATRICEILDSECRRLLGMDSCFIATLEPDGRTRFVYTRRPGGRPIASEDSTNGFVKRVFDGCRPVKVDDLRALGPCSPLRRAVVDSHTRSVLAVPLIVDGRVTGALAVQSRKPGAYGLRELALLTSIADQAIVALEAARRHEHARTDSLTGFLLRDPFFRRLDEEAERVRRYGGCFALLMVDLDGFKEINDTSGHFAGDRYLGEIALAIREKLRGADLACRYGGDEFCLLLPETGPAGARAIAERIREAVALRTVDFDGRALKTTASIGLACYPEHDAEDPRGLMRMADEALYRAKRNGRDRVVPFAA